MFWELPSMIQKLDLATWKPTKWVFVTTFLVVTVAVLVARYWKGRQGRNVHLVLIAVALVALLANFIYGGLERGFLGTTRTQPHSTLWMLTFGVHLTTSLCFAIAAIRLGVYGHRIMWRQPDLETFNAHRRIGYRAYGGLFLSVLTALPL